jgi:hypothetical protein
MTTFSIASILADQNLQDDKETKTIDEQQQALLNTSVQHLYSIFCKNAALAAQLTDHHPNKSNLIRSFPMESSSTSSTDFYSLHKLNPTSSYQGNYLFGTVFRREMLAAIDDY